MSIQSISSSPPGNVSNYSPQSRPSATESATASDVNSAKTAAVTQQTATQDAQASKQQLDDAVKAVSSIVGSVNNSLEFSVDGSSGKTVVKIVDTGTKEVIRQIPSEEMIAIAKALDGIKGLLVRQKA